MAWYHSLIIGITGSGKTMLGKTLCAQTAGRTSPHGLRIEAMVLDELMDPEWKAAGASWVTSDRELFYRTAHDPKNRGCLLLLDESRSRGWEHPEHAEWFATQARHWGHSSIFMCQRLIQLHPTIRDNCSTWYIFKTSPRDISTLADELGRPELLADDLGPGDFYRIRNFQPTCKYHLDFATRHVKLIA